MRRRGDLRRVKLTNLGQEENEEEHTSSAPMKIFFEIRKQKYLEALDRQDKGKAVEILVQDLRVFSTFNEDLYKEITQLLILQNFSEKEQLSKNRDTKQARTVMLSEVQKLIEVNPLFRDKLTFPTLRSLRLRTLINQSLKKLCKDPRNPNTKTLFTDHTCAVTNGPLSPSSVNQPVTTLTKPTALPSLGAHGRSRWKGGKSRKTTMDAVAEILVVSCSRGGLLRGEETRGMRREVEPVVYK